MRLPRQARLRKGDVLSELSDERREALDGALTALEGCLVRLERFVRALSQAEFTGHDQSVVAAGLSGSIGSHVRHILDHLEALLSGHDSPSGVDYDARERGGPTERVPSLALARIAQIRGRLHGLRCVRGAHPLHVKMMTSKDAPGVTLVSTFARELVFVWHHAVHHCAYIDLLAHHAGLTERTGVGIAPSTEAFVQLRRGAESLVTAGE